jgi:uncharacterized C2H2 Zn-finger protein
MASDLLRELWEQGLPKCPWCGYVIREPWDYEMHDGDTLVEECPKCDKEFEIRCSVEITYSTEKVAEWRECETCGGTGFRLLDAKELAAVNLTEGKIRCEDCRGGKKYVTTRERRGTGMDRLMADPL